MHAPLSYFCSFSGIQYKRLLLFGYTLPSQGVAEDRESSQPAAVAPSESAADKKVTTAPAAVAAATPAANAVPGGATPSNGSILVDME